MLACLQVDSLQSTAHTHEGGELLENVLRDTPLLKLLVDHLQQLLQSAGQEAKVPRYPSAIAWCRWHGAIEIGLPTPLYKFVLTNAATYCNRLAPSAPPLSCCWMPPSSASSCSVLASKTSYI